jgi:hypothetical protein
MSGSIHDREQAAAQAAGRLNLGNTYDDWLMIADGLQAGRESAMAAAQCNTPFGLRYRRELKAWRARNAWTANPRLHNSVVSNCYWLIDNLAQVEAWRATLTDDEREAYNHPTAIKRQFQKAQRGGPGGQRGRRGPHPGNPSRQAKAALAALQKQIAELQIDNDALMAALNATREAFDKLAEEYARMEKELAKAKKGDAADGRLPTLGMEPPYTLDGVKARHRLLIALAHPDKGGTNVWAKLVNKDYAAGKKWLKEQQAASISATNPSASQSSGAGLSVP